MRYQGRITTWQDDKGFGFITPNGGDARIFVHIKSFSNRQRRPAGNEIVTYELKVDDKKRAQAAVVAFVGEQMLPSSSSGYSIIPPLFACSFLIFVAASAFTGKLPKVVLALYLVASIIAFFAYAFDKSAAKNNRWRTQESTLHLFALVGGWPGALAAQRLLRHKSNKTSFQSVFWGTVFLNCGGVRMAVNTLWRNYSSLHSRCCVRANPALNLAPFSRWTLRDIAAQRRLPLRWASE